MRIDPRFKLDLAVSREDRPAIQHVYVHRRATDGRPTAVATDGHILALVPVEPTMNAETGAETSEVPPVTEPGLLIPPDALKHAQKKANHGQLSLAVGEQNGKPQRAVSTPDGRGWAIPTGEDAPTYPDYPNVLPDEGRPSGYRVTLDAQLLFNLARALGASDHHVTLEFGKSNLDAIRVTPANPVEDEFGILLPVYMSR